MNGDILFFFEDRGSALALYEKLEGEILSRVEGVRVKVSKTQIAFSQKRGFTCVSFLPARKAALRSKDFITVTFGLGYRKDSPRIDAATEPYPGRWTHHVTVNAPCEIDEELLNWITEAAAFSAAKR